jgi:hypothetical protein
MLQAGRLWVRFLMRSLEFSIDLILPATLWPQPLTEMSARNLPGGKGRPARGGDNLTAICEQTVYKMWEPRHLTTLWAFTGCYRDSFTFLLFMIVKKRVFIRSADQKNFNRNMSPVITWESMEKYGSCYQI